ncbi:MAG: hypothetical protein ACE5IO_05630, partial [Thermoplasmata archaeon]
MAISGFVALALAVSLCDHVSRLKSITKLGKGKSVEITKLEEKSPQPLKTILLLKSLGRVS